VERILVAAVMRVTASREPSRNMLPQLDLSSREEIRREMQDCAPTRGQGKAG
jgi:hypothetical protein